METVRGLEKQLMQLTPLSHETQLNLICILK